jgi:hypothetical protein
MTNIKPLQSVVVTDHFLHFTAGDVFDSFEEFTLKCKDTAICTLRVEYTSDSVRPTKTDFVVHKVDHAVPMCAGDLHVIASMINTIMHHFTSDHTTLGDSFIDDEGFRIGHALIVSV